MITPTSMPTMPQTTVITANWRTTLSLYVPLMACMRASGNVGTC